MHRQIESPWNRRGGHGENIHRAAHGFDLVFLAHTKAVLFIDNQQAEPLKVDLGVLLDIMLPQKLLICEELGTVFALHGLCMISLLWNFDEIFIDLFFMVPPGVELNPLSIPAARNAKEAIEG